MDMSRWARACAGECGRVGLGVCTYEVAWLQTKLFPVELTANVNKNLGTQASSFSGAPVCGPHYFSPPSISNPMQGGARFDGQRRGQVQRGPGVPAQRHPRGGSRSCGRQARSD